MKKPFVAIALLLIESLFKKMPEASSVTEAAKKEHSINDNLVKWTKYLTICTLFLVLLAGGQLWQMHSDARSSDKSTGDQISVLKAQSDALKEQSEALKGQLRPVLYIRLSDFPHWEADGQALVRHRFSNAGNGLALNLQKVTKSGVFPINGLPDEGAGLKYPDDSEVIAKSPTNDFLAPHAELEADILSSLPDNEWARLTSQKPDLLWAEWGMARYEDVFGLPHHLWFCSIWNGHGAQTVKCPKGNRVD